jgi:uncharacterized protein (DUF1501 family)
MSMQRRRFLSSLAAGSLLIPVGRSALAAVNEAPPVTGVQNRLIVIFKRGAVDGLSVVVPYAESNYYAWREGIAIARPGMPGGALDLDGRFGLHPALAPVYPLWKNGTLAFVHAAGSPDATRSHFDAQDFMESGTPGAKATPDGWMNRLLAALPGAAPAGAPTRAVSVGPVLPRIYAGRMSVANIASGQAATRETVLDRPQVDNAFAQLYQGDDRLARAYQDGRAAHREVMATMDEAGQKKEMQEANNGAPLPNGFPDDAARLARLMHRDARVQLAFMAVGGWDTHANQGAEKGQLANRLQPFAQGLAALVDGLGPTYAQTTIVVMSEFGRTVRQNGNGGTDHGHGNVMWVLGGGVAGGKVHGEWPGLSENRLYQGRDLAVTTDFRTVVAQIAERRLLLGNAEIRQVFPDLPRPERRLELIHA